MTRTCIVTPHYAGLFSLINKVLTCAEMYEEVHVDFTDGTIYSPPGVNLWNELFEPTKPPTEEADIIHAYPHQNYTYRNVAPLYSDDAWRKRMFPLVQKFGIRTDLLHDAARWGYERNLPVGGFLAVQICSNPHGGEQVDGTIQTLDQYAAAIEADLEHLDDQRVFLMCNDWRSIQWMSQRFNVIFNDATQRAETRDAERHLEVPQTIEDAKQVMREVITVMTAQTFIHPISNMATFALCASPKLQSIFLQ